MAEQKNKLKQPVEPADVTQHEDEKSVHIERQPEEIGGPRGLEPTRYGDWERKGRCIDF